MSSPNVHSLQREYDVWKATHRENGVPDEAAPVLRTDFELLYALDTCDQVKLSDLMSSIADRVAETLWNDTESAFANAAAAHSFRLLQRRPTGNVVDRVWQTVELMLTEPDSYQDAVLDGMLSWVESLLPEDGRTAVVFRTSVRDFLLEIALVEGVKYELDGRRSHRPAVELFQAFVDAKTACLISGDKFRQARDDLSAQIVEGLLGYGDASGLWGGRRTIWEFDRSQSSLAAFVITTARYVLLDAGFAPDHFHISNHVLGSLETDGLPSDLLGELTSLHGKSWRTWGGLSKAMRKTVPRLFEKGNERWLSEVRCRAAVYQARGIGRLDDETSPDPIANSADPGSISGDPQLEALVDVVLDPVQFDAFLENWDDLSPADRKRLRDKFVLVNTVVLRDTIDELYGAYSAPRGSAQLKFVLLQGITTLAVGAAGGETPHLRHDELKDGSARPDSLAQAGFHNDRWVEFGAEQNTQSVWDLWRVVYTVIFLATVRRVDPLRAALKFADDIRDEPDGGSRIPLAWLSLHALEKTKERQLSRSRIEKLVRSYGESLRRLIASDETLGASGAMLEMRIESDSVVARGSYPYVFLAGYAPNAFATMYWNLLQKKSLNISQMRSKLKDLRVSLSALRRFLR